MKDCKHIDTNKFEFIQMDTKIFDKNSRLNNRVFGDASGVLCNKSSVMGFYFSYYYHHVDYRPICRRSRRS